MSRKHRISIPQLEEGCAQAMCSCGWRSPVFGADKTTGTMDPLQQAMEAGDHGYRNFTNYRLRLLLHCGTDWNTPTATPIRGRLPRLAA
jgi:hypothetical protein